MIILSHCHKLIILIDYFVTESPKSQNYNLMGPFFLHSQRRLVLERPQERPPGGLQAERELVDGVSPDRREPAS